MKRIIFQTSDKQYRIVELVDQYVSMDDLKGDIFNRDVNPDIPEDRMAREEKEFEQEVEMNGVFGYVLERWNPNPGMGYQHMDSCWGFIGQYDATDEKYNHYIVREVKSQIPTEFATNNLGGA